MRELLESLTQNPSQGEIPPSGIVLTSDRGEASKLIRNGGDDPTMTKTGAKLK